jgi:hypothetical protein
MDIDKKYVYWGLGAVGLLIVYYVATGSRDSGENYTGSYDAGGAVLGSPYVSLQGDASGTDAPNNDALANVQLELGKLQIENEKAFGLGQIDLQKAQIQAALDTAHISADSAARLQQQQVDALGLSSLLATALNPGESRNITTSSGATITAGSTIGQGSAADWIRQTYRTLTGQDITDAQLAKIQASGLNQQQLTANLMGTEAFAARQNTQEYQIVQAFRAKYGQNFTPTAGIVDWIQAKIQGGQDIQSAVKAVGAGVTPKMITNNDGDVVAAISRKRKIGNTGLEFTVAAA